MDNFYTSVYFRLQGSSTPPHTIAQMWGSSLRLLKSNAFVTHVTLFSHSPLCLMHKHHPRWGSNYLLVLCFICIAAYQLLIGYLMIQLDSLLNNCNHNYIFNVPWYFLFIITCLQTVVWFQVFLSNTNNLHSCSASNVLKTN